MLTLTFRTIRHSFALALVLIAMATLGFLTEAALAGTVILSGTHSRSSIKASCGAAGGDYSGEAGHYGCTTKNGSVQCNNQGKCYGDCGNCGATASGGSGTVSGILRTPVGGVTLKPGNNPPPKRTAGPIRVKPPIAVSNPGGTPNNGGPHHGGNPR